MSLNPPSANVRTSEVKRLRIENQLAQERIRQARLARVQRIETRRTELLESISPNWLPAYADYLDRLNHRDPWLAGGTARWQRRRGQNYPIFQTEQELQLLRAPSRLLLATNSYAQGLMEGLTSYVIGTGYTYRAAAKDDAIAAQLPEGLVESCQHVIDEFLLDNDWHGGEQPSLEDELFQRSVGDGDVGLVHYKQPGGQTQVRVADADQITMPPGADPREYSFGVYTDPRDPQKELAYWLQFGDVPGDGEEFSPDEFTFLKRNAVRGVKRGVPDYSFDTAERLRLAGVLCENLTEGAAIQAAIVGVRQHATASQEQIQRFVDDDKDWDEPNPINGNTTPARRARVGMEDMPQGQQYVPGPGANNSPAHIQVLEAALRGAGIRWNAPEWLATGTGSAINYASSLTTESPFVRTVLRRQRTYRECFRRPVVFALQWAAESGRIRDANGNVWTWEALRRVIDVQCEAPSPETRNLLEDAQRAAIEIPLGVDSRQQFAQRHDRDWDRVTADNRDWLAENGREGPPLPLPDDRRESLLESRRLLESKDEHGHDHDKDGKFTSGGGSGGKTAEKPKPSADAVQSRLDNNEFGVDSSHLDDLKNEFRDDPTVESAKSVGQSHLDHFRETAGKLDDLDLSPTERRSAQSAVKKAESGIARATAKVEKTTAKIDELKGQLSKAEAQQPPYSPPQEPEYPDDPADNAGPESEEPDPANYDRDSPEGDAAYQSDLADHEAYLEAVEAHQDKVAEIDAAHEKATEKYESEYQRAVEKRERVIEKLGERIEDMEGAMTADFEDALSQVENDFDGEIHDAVIDHLNRLDEQQPARSGNQNG